MPRKLKCECGDCKTCDARTRKQAWAVAHPDKNRAARAKWVAANPEKARESDRAWAAANRPSINKRQRAYTAADPERRREQRRRACGIADAHLAPLLEILQQGRCAICQQPRPTNDRHWHADHDHSTGHMRGMLCHHCNALLGMARDSLLVLVHAIHYLQDPPAAKLKRASNT